MNNPVFILLFNFVTGTACLMYGVNEMSTGLEHMNLQKIKSALAKLTGRLIPAVITGTVITALVQSSTAVTVITVSLVNSGLMKLPQAVGIIYGANIGTTVTAQLMSFKVTDLALPVLAAGLLIRMISKRASVKNFGKAVMGFGFMFLGITILNLGVPYIKESSYVYELFKAYGTNPYLGLVLGMATTMLVHSSSATVGLTIVLFNAGLISFEAALGLTLGDNIGTCITAQLASLGSNLQARRAAWSHTFYNVLGVTAAVIFLLPFSGLVQHVTAMLGQDHTRLVANAHTVFNVLSAAVFLPVTKYYVRFITWVIPGKNTI